MARYILIDNCSGYIFGDSADFDGRIFDGSPVEFAEALDASIGEYGRSYELVSSSPRDTSTGYHVYRADVNGADAVCIITDGQSQEQIEAVERDCEYVGYIAISRDR